MNVLAVRNNSLFWKIPIIFVIGTAIICFIGRLHAPVDAVIPEDMTEIGYFYLLGLTEPMRSVRRISGVVWLISRGSILYGISMLFVKNVIIEYDDAGIYIYRLFKPIKTIRYEELWSQMTREDFDVVYVKRRFTFSWWKIENYHKITDPFFGLIKTGTLRIETPNELINIRGIKDVKKVEVELNKLITAKRKENIAEMEKQIAYQNRLDELKELAKHNPYT